MYNAEDLASLLEYLESHPNEVKRFNQCFNCAKIAGCSGNCEENEEGMCLECLPLVR